MTLATPFARERIERLLHIEPDSKPRVYLQVFKAAEFADLNYVLELLFSAGIATLGLVLDSPAVVIGGHAHLASDGPHPGRRFGVCRR